MSDNLECYITDMQLDLACEIATDVIEVYGDFSDDATWHQFRNVGIWKDHPAVQAVLAALSPPYRAQIATLAEENRKRLRQAP